MSARITLLLVLAVTMTAWSQVEPSATGGTPASLDDAQMMMPPPVSGIPYPNQTTVEAASSSFTTAVAVHGAYVDNILPSLTATPVNDFTYSILPTLELQSTASRQEARLSYSPSFIFYKTTSALDAVDHNATATYQYRISPQFAFSLQNYFVKTSNVFDQSTIFTQPGVPGSTQLPVTTIIAPYAEQLTDNFSGDLSYQFGRNGMVGAGGTAAVFDLQDSSNAAGLYNSHSEGGFAFYDRRLSRSQYAGLVYQYARVIASPTSGQIETQTHSFLPFYTFYFSRTFSISLGGGAEHVDVAQSSSPAIDSWAPVATASVGWQGARGSFAASYLRTVSSGGGLIGAYNTNSVSGSAGWNLTKTWVANISGAFSNINNLTAQVVGSFNGGHTISGQASISHRIGDYFSFGGGYERLREEYAGVAVIAADPDSNQEFFTLTYQLKKTLGR
jgi:hypothetical protein